MWRILPVLALCVAGVSLAASLAVAGETLGYDFLAYHGAADRVLQGRPLYDVAADVAGPFGLFIYPPTFIPLVLVFGLLAPGPATWAWIGLLLAAFGLGVALLPVSRRVRWLVVLLAAQSWPFLYAVKLGQVGPLLFLLFVIGWRWLDRPLALGGTGALGAAIKLQPGIVLAWALLTRRWAAVAAGAAVLAVLALVATLLTGGQAWLDFMRLIGRVSNPIETPHNVTPGAIAYQYGAALDTASLVQWLSTVLVVLAVVVAALRLPATPSYLVAVIASQLLSPVLWDHYAMLLLLPVAWMMDRGQWWAVAFVLATSVLIVGLIPAWIYPAAYWACLVGVVLTAGRDGRGVVVRPAPSRGTVGT